ncbi:MAG: phosphoenolpyruvate--protein phosphotransferase [Candidatus Pelethousia sp.]|nr:phosphoenolpyruvate--protein phosphotransferase [Candidatus Pelethousia sp.]
MRIFKGNPVSPGLSTGSVYQYKAYACDVFEAYVQPGQELGAVAKYQEAVGLADKELRDIIASFSQRDADKAKIFSAHRAFLGDEEMDEEIRAAILERRQAPDFAVNRVFTEYAALLSAAKDPLIASRAMDLRDVRNRLVRILHGEPERNLSRLGCPVVVVAHDLLPSDTATMDRANVLAIITEVGGSTSHSAILARAFGIPAVLGVPDATKALPHGAAVIVDALNGEVLLDPDASALRQYEEKRAAYQADRRDAAQYFAQEPRLKDGTPVEIGLNIGARMDKDAIEVCSFVGLFRTEFLYMESERLPAEMEQFAVYRAVLEQAKGRPVTLRTLDVGGDKTLPALPLPKEDNPFLGCRALRLCLEKRELFLTQLRAALRASAYGKLQIMFPMVGSLDDLRAAKEVLEEARAQLRGQQIPFDESMPVGIMIEIPSIALLADVVAAACDFASIGTNDLCQYLHAADRMNAQVAGYYQSFSPAMFRAIKMVLDAFNARGKPVSVCGEMAGSALAAPALAGLGLRKFSMNAACIADVKRALAQYTLEEAQALSQKVINLDTEAAVKALLANAAG